MFIWLRLAAERQFYWPLFDGFFSDGQEMFRRNRANQSQVVWLFASPAKRRSADGLDCP